MKRLKRALSSLLVAAMLVTTVPAESLLAETVSAESTEAVSGTEILESTEQTEAVEQTETTEQTEGTEDAKQPESTEKTEDTEQKESTEKTEDTELKESTESKDKLLPEGTEALEDTEELEEETETEEAEAEYAILYAMLEESNVALNGVQKVVLGVDGEEKIERAVLQYRNQETGEILYQDSSEIADGAVLFQMSFDSEAQTGSYQLDAVTFIIDGKEYTEILSGTGLDAVFGVNREVDSEPDAIIEEDPGESEVVDMDVVRIDTDGNTTSETTLKDAIENAEEEHVLLYGESASKARDIVVVLDPGHDNTHAGAQANGLGEEKLNIKIAAFCKAELEEYNGVKVYLTRGLDGSCPYPGTTSGKCNENRVAYAKSVGADIFVSLHNNSAANTSAKGAMVFYPNGNYNPGVSQTGKGLAQVIENHLVALGLYNRGITIRNAQETKYPDGSAADYYGVIRNCKLAGIPAIIVEHSFLTNAGDVNNFLNSDEKLKMLGVADATAIAEYYGLSKSVEVTSGQVQITNVDNSKGVAAMSVSNVAPSNKISKVSFAVWSKSDQSDLAWYDAYNNGTGTYQATLDISRHQYNIGAYYADGYAYDIYGGAHYLGSSTCTFTAQKAKIAVAGNDAQTVYWISLTNAIIPSGVKATKFAVWSAANGQDDLRWYTGAQTGNGSYSAAIYIENHKTAGMYYVDAYAVNGAGKDVFLCSSSFKVDEISGGKVSAEKVDSQSGSFDVVVKGISSTSGTQKVQIPVWGKADQSDLHWYTAEKQSDGSYVAHVSIANHGYRYGSYLADAYATAGNGLNKYIGGVSVDIKVPSARVAAEGNAAETNYAVWISGVKMAGEAQSVKVAVWSASGGQDDLRWYTAGNAGSGNWNINVPITNHKTSGVYYADAYVTDASGNASFLGGTQFKVSAPSTGKVSIGNVNEGAGSFDIRVSGVSAKAGISKLQVPVWSKADQSDLHWYTAEQQSDGSFLVYASIRNHNYNYGKYYADAYATAGNGLNAYVGGSTATMNMPRASVSVADNGAQTWFGLTASNVGVAGGAKSLSFAVWSQDGGQDDLNWYEANQVSSGVWNTSVQIARHKTAGKYFADAYVKSAAGGFTYIGGITFQVTKPTVEAVSLVNADEAGGTFGVKLSGVKAAAGILDAKVAVWSAGNQSDLRWYQAVQKADGTYQVDVDIRNHQNNIGTYYADAYITDYNGVSIYGGGVSCPMTNVSNVMYPVMGAASVTVKQMAEYYKARAYYPSFYSNTEAPTIETFCRIYLEECQYEGVRAEVAFCQAMKETGFLRFGGNVSIGQYNFAGLGSTGPGVAGESYPDVRTGIRAQIQHLKAYGNSEPLNLACVDSRFRYVTRNTAPYVEWLGIKENPYGKGWATAQNYGYDIVRMIKDLKTY